MRVETVPAVRLSPSPAVEAYLTDYARVAAAYEYDWARQESFVRRAVFLRDGGYRGRRQAVAAALERYNRALGADQAVLNNIRLLERDDCLAVVAGQQPVIFTGPAYTVYKAMTAIRLARIQSERLGQPVVPVFWIAAEDHDWHEVSWVLAPSAEGTVRYALSEPLEGERRSVGLAPMPPSVTDLVEAFIATLPETEFKPEVAQRIREAAADPPALDPALTGGRPSLADWFARLMTWMFRGTGLIMLNASDPALRQIEADFFVQAIREQEKVTAAYAAGCRRWEALGFTPTVEQQPESMHLFTYVAGERLPLMGRGNRCWVRDREAELQWSRDDLIERAAAHPECFSTNVMLRPVVQGVLLPDLAVVAGPGEISYFGLFRDVYRVLGGQMPVVYPRESFTLVEPPIARIMAKQGLTLEDVFFRLDERKQELLEREDRLGIGRLFAEFRASFGSQYAALIEQVLKLDPHLSQVAEENRRQIAVQINKLEEKARQQHRKNCEVALRQFERLKATLIPGGPQERAVSVLPYLAKYGPDLVQRLLAATDLPDRWVHRAVYLGG